jgi:hypothetical protein
MERVDFRVVSSCGEDVHIPDFLVRNFQGCNSYFVK